MSCKGSLVPGLCFICHLCKLFSRHQSFPQLTCKFLKIRNHVLYSFCKPRTARIGDVDKILLHWLCCLPSVCVCVCVLVTQPGLTLCDPMDYYLSGSSVHRILQARILERVAISFSRASSRPRDRTRVPSVYLKHISFTSPSFSLLMWKRGNNIFWGLN